MPDKKTIFITGAASGIGRETALLFARKGWYVAMADTNGEGLLSLQEEIGRERCFAERMDVTDPKNVEKTFGSLAEQTGGKLDVLFNNAGVLEFGRFESVPLEKSLQIVDVNLKGILNCTYFALNYLKKSDAPRIVNMASTSAVYGVPDLTAYSASKHAVCAVTESLDIELESYGIKVSDILAPYVRTPLLDRGDEIYSIQKMGVTLFPSTIAEVVWKVIHGNTLHWKIGAATHALLFLFWLLPFLRRSIVKHLTIKPGKHF